MTFAITNSLTEDKLALLLFENTSILILLCLAAGFIYQERLTECYTLWNVSILAGEKKKKGGKRLIIITHTLGLFKRSYYGLTAASYIKAFCNKAYNTSGPLKLECSEIGKEISFKDEMLFSSIQSVWQSDAINASIYSSNISCCFKYFLGNTSH